MSTGRDAGDADVDPAANTEAATPPRSPSDQALHRDAKAAPFSGAKIPEIAPGELLGGRYRIAGLIGRGGMGEVYRAHDTELGEDVALKFLPRAYTSNAALRARFVEEVRLARQITHACVCRVHDIGEANGRYFLSMELIDGEDLSSLLRRIGRLPQEKALELAQQLCSGLAALHARGVLHRDLKPSNVMIDGDGRLKLADFGLAALQAELRPEQARDGTPAYMAPEQAAGKEVTTKSDIFALGLVLYELISGRHAFASGIDPTGKPQVDRGSTPASIATHVRGLPLELDDVIRACLDENPALRPESALAVASALPGGDPVAAAIAAGRAPSVEAVAGLQLVGTLPVWVAYGIAALIVVATLVYAAVQPSLSLLVLYHQERSVEVLTHRAREVLESATELPKKRDSIVVLNIDRDYFRALATDDVVAAEATSPVALDYRQSPEELDPRGPNPSMTDPPMRVPGEASVTLDGRGRLLALQIVPATHRSASAPYDFTGLLGSAGLDPNAVVPTQPVTVPPFFADQQLAWTGVLIESGVAVTVEAAALDGKPVFFQVYTPWSPLPSASAVTEPEILTPDWSTHAIVALVFGSVILVGLLARRSIRRGDADLRGALQTAIAVGASVVVHVFFMSHHAGPERELAVWSWIARNTFIFGGFSFLCYVIVEPYARRYLPGTMVGWTRLMRGRWRDPLIARDVLVGTVAALAVTWIALVKALVLRNGKIPEVPALEVLLGGGHAFAFAAQSVWFSLMGFLQFFVMFLALHFVLGKLTRRHQRTWMAAVLALWALIQAFLGFNGLEDGTSLQFALLLAIALGTTGMVVCVVARFGLLAAVAMQISINLLVFFPVTLDFDTWYAPYGSFALVGIAAMTLFGLRCARPGR